MTLIHHADHLAELPAKRVLRYEVSFASGRKTAWRSMEEFDTTEPVVEGLPENYIEQIVYRLCGKRERSQGRDRPRPFLAGGRAPFSLSRSSGWKLAQAI